MRDEEGDGEGDLDGLSVRDGDCDGDGSAEAGDGWTGDGARDGDLRIVGVRFAPTEGEETVAEAIGTAAVDLLDGTPSLDRDASAREGCGPVKASSETLMANTSVLHTTSITLALDGRRFLPMLAHRDSLVADFW